MTAEELSQIEAIKILKARYCRYADEGKAEFFDLFTDDAVFGEPAAAHEDPDSPEAKYKAGYLVGRKAIQETMSKMGQFMSPGMHQVYAPEIELTSPTTAKGVWAYSDHLFFHSGPVKAAHGLGHYHETYELQYGVWKIKTCIPVRIRVDVEMAEPEAAA